MDLTAEAYDALARVAGCSNTRALIEESPMADKSDVSNSAAKDPHDWVTGDEPATGPQQSYLHTLAQQAHEEVPDDLSKAEASMKIEELQAETGRGQ